MEPHFLIVETSCRVAKLALSEGDHVLVERQLEETRRHARDLAPTVGELLGSLRWKPKDVTAVVVSIGPGSYTGLRVGIMSAKAFAYATRVPLVAIPTFEAIARQVADGARELVVIADAQQGRVYAQEWACHEVDEGFRPRSELQIVAFSELLAGLDRSTWLSGPAIGLFESQLRGFHVVDDKNRLPSCRSLAEIAVNQYDMAPSDALWTVEPIYLRPSAAEEQWDKKQHG